MFNSYVKLPEGNIYLGKLQCFTNLKYIGMIPLTNHDSSEGEQWGRYNLPRYIYVYTIYDQPLDDLSLSCHESRSALVPRNSTLYPGIPGPALHLEGDPNG